jgi:hypothetical protein
VAAPARVMLPRRPRPQHCTASAPDVEPAGAVVALLVGFPVNVSFGPTAVGAAEDGAAVGAAINPQSSGQSNPSSAYVQRKYSSMSSLHGAQSHVTVRASQMEVEYSSHVVSGPCFGRDAPTHMSQSYASEVGISFWKHDRYCAHCCGQMGMVVGWSVNEMVGTADGTSPAPPWLVSDGLVDGTSEGASDDVVVVVGDPTFMSCSSIWNSPAHIERLEASRSACRRSAVMGVARCRPLHVDGKG